MAPAGSGVRTTQKVRLVHASIRQFLKGHPDWDPAWGEPINQEDLAGTLMAFSQVVLDGLPSLGVEVADEDAEAYLHCWKVVGHVLGVREELLPRDREDARALWAAIRRRHFERSDAGTELTAALLAFVHEVLPGNALGIVADATARHLVGDVTADMLGMPRHATDAIAFHLVEFFAHEVDEELEHHEVIRRLAPHFNRRLITGLEHSWADGTKVVFRIPPSLEGSWG